MSALTAPVTVYVPRDSAARSVGADEVADALARAAARSRTARFELVRNGSRGMLWLEPLVEVATPDGRIGYGPVAASDVDGLVAAGLFDGAELPQRVGVVDDCPGWRRRIGSPSPGWASPIRCRPTTTCVTAASSDWFAHWRFPRRRWSRRSRTPACAGAAARASRQASSGRRCSTASTS